MAKNTIEKISTPKAKLAWVNISGEGKENLSGKTKYVATAIVPADCQAVQAIKAFWDANKPAGFKSEPKSESVPKGYKSIGIYPHKVDSGRTDEDGDKIYEVVDDLVELRFSTDTTFPDGKPKVIQIYNSKNRKVSLPEGTQIGNDSVGCISGAMSIYTTEKAGKILDAGVTLYLNAIQILKLKEYEADAGFEAHDEEDGWTGDEGWTGETEASVEPEAKVKL